MPYIKKFKRLQLGPSLYQIRDCMENGGDLNYCFTKLCHMYMEKYGESYQNYSDCLAALEGAKLEFYRKKVAPYEDIKEKDNGPV